MRKSFISFLIVWFAISILAGRPSNAAYYYAAASAGGGGGIAFDAGSSSARDLGGAFADLTWAHTVAAGSNRALVVSVGSLGNAAVTISSVTYNGVGMTAMWAQTDTSSGVEAKQRSYFLAAPATGTNNVIITLSANGVGTLAGAAASFSGVNQTGTVGNSWRTPVISDGSSSDIVVANAVSGDYVVDGMGIYNTTGVIAPNHTNVATQDPVTVGSVYAHGMQYHPATGSTTMSWTNMTLFSGGAAALIPAP